VQLLLPERANTYVLVKLVVIECGVLLSLVYHVEVRCKKVTWGGIDASTSNYVTVVLDLAAAKSTFQLFCKLTQRMKH